MLIITDFVDTLFANALYPDGVTNCELLLIVNC